MRAFWRRTKPADATRVLPPTLGYRVMGLLVGEQERNQLLLAYGGFWRTGTYGNAPRPGTEAETWEKEWVRCAEPFLVPVQELVADAVVFNSAIGRGLLQVNRLTDRAIFEAGEYARETGGILYWSDLTGLLVIDVSAAL
jgi:hypothetical protein